MAAWEGLAAVYAVVEGWGIVGREYPKLALEAAQTALALNDGLSLAYSTIGLVFSDNHPFRWKDAIENFKLATENGSKNATNFLFLAGTYMTLGYSELAMNAINQCLGLDPQYGNCHRFKAMIYLLLGERDKGIDLLLRSLESGVTGPQPLFVSALALSGHRIAALLLADSYTGHTGAPIKEWVNLIENPNIDRSEALRAFDHWVERENISVNMFIPMLIAFGIYDQATHESHQGYIWSIWLPEFAKFRQSPQFKKLVSEYEMLPFWQSHGFPPQCRPIGDQDFECD